jgi:hypothetical protein
MKITKIEEIDGIYHVTKTPSFLARLFGAKNKVERYKTNGESFHYFNHITVFYREDGKMLGPMEKMTGLLNNHIRKF